MELKTGILGLGRGAAYFQAFNRHRNAEVVAICDKVIERAEAFAKQTKLKNFCSDYQELLEHDLDIVVVCTPPIYHAENVIDALKAGKHVLSEVPATYSLEECERVVRAVEKTGLKYMLAENYRFFAYIESLKKMINEGRLGEIIYTEGEYVQDCRDLMKEDDRLTWRATMPPIYYCTHSLGPLLYLMNDRCVTATGLHTGCNVAPDLGAIDMEVGLFKTESGAVVKILCGFSIVREPTLVWYSLYGTKGCVEGKRCGWDKFKGYFENRMRGLWRSKRDMIPKPLSIPRVRASPEDLIVDGFIQSIINDTKPPIDVYEAMDYTAPGICAHRSAQAGGKVVEVPNYRKDAT